MKKKLKQIFIGTIISVEFITFGWVYRSSGYGSKALYQLRAQTEQVDTAVAQLNKEIMVLEHELTAWQSHPFFKEKVAREQLQMARQGDTVYVEVG
jgi:cell division protein FtsB